MVLLPLLMVDQAGSFQASTTHAVMGQVTDAHGSPVGTAFVAVTPLDSSGSAGDLRWVRTDEKGAFRVVLTSGHYVIRAKDEAHGYPDPSFMFSADPNSVFPEISVDQSDVSGLRVVLGLQGGIVEGDLRDQATQTPVPKGKVTIRDARNSESYVEVFADKAGHFQFTVPSKPIQVLATAPSYKTAYFNKGEEVTLSGGEHRTVNLALQLE